MHQNPSNTEIEEDNYTQTPLQFSVHEEAVSYFNDVHCLPLPVKRDLFPRWSVKYNTLQYKECNLANCYFLQKGYISIIIFNKLSFITEYRYTTWTWFRSGTLKYLVNSYFTSINRNVPATQWNLHMFSEGPFCCHQSTELWFYMPDRGKKCKN